MVMLFKSSLNEKEIVLESIGMMQNFKWDPEIRKLGQIAGCSDLPFPFERICLIEEDASNYSLLSSCIATDNSSRIQLKGSMMNLSLSHGSVAFCYLHDRWRVCRLPPQLVGLSPPYLIVVILLEESLQSRGYLCDIYCIF